MVSVDTSRTGSYCRKIFVINFEAIFMSKIEHIYAIEEGRAGEQSALVSVAN
jgi:hypothetical protein